MYIYIYIYIYINNVYIYIQLYVHIYTLYIQFIVVCYVFFYFRHTLYVMLYVYEDFLFCDTSTTIEQQLQVCQRSHEHLYEELL